MDPLRQRIARMVYTAKDGHIPSAFSIVDILSTLYTKILKYDPRNPQWEDRDYFILSKGHGCVGLYVVLKEAGFVEERDLEEFCTVRGILGEHPDCTKVPGVEASTGSLGHGFPLAVGLAFGLKIQKKPNRVITLVGDGECHEGTVWEAANIANNHDLGNLCVIVDWNKSAAQLMPKDDLAQKWKAFGWEVQEVDGHNKPEIESAINAVKFKLDGTPHVILAHTTKGKGVPFIEGHGPWHHKVPSEQELEQIMELLS